MNGDKTNITFIKKFAAHNMLELLVSIPAHILVLNLLMTNH
jgi:hypothetical protein